MNRQRAERPEKRKGIPWLAAAVLLAVAAAVCRMVPGMGFCGAAGMAGTAVCLIGWWLQRQRGPAGRRCYRAFGALVCAGLAAFAVLEAAVLSQIPRGGDWPQADTVIVLGAGVNGTQPSLVLQSRIDTAAEYLHRYPQATAILSGGKGADERLSEAEAMRRGLEAQGIARNRLILEDRSVNTAENFRNSGALLRQMDPQPQTVAVITSGFHCCRARLLAHRTGLNPAAIPAKRVYPWLEANYTIREAFALVKTLIFDRGDIS